MSSYYNYLDITFEKNQVGEGTCLRSQTQDMSYKPAKALILNPGWKGHTFSIAPCTEDMHMDTYVFKCMQI